MLPRALLLIALSLLAAGAANAQAKPRRLPPPRPAPDVVVAPVKPVSPAAPAPFSPLRTGGLIGLTPVGDQAPACRAQCSKDRYVCHAAGDATDCDGRWVPCLQACSAR